MLIKRTQIILALAALMLSGMAARAGAAQSQATLARGGKVVVNGGWEMITVTGWGRDTVAARVTGDAAEGPAEVRAAGDATRPVVVVGAARDGRPRHRRDSHLTVNIPRYADLEITEGWHGGDSVTVSDVEGAVVVKNGRGDARISRVGSLQITRMHGDITVDDVKGQLIARSTNGDMTISKVGGRAEVAATNGTITLRDAGDDVRVNTASGDIEIHCTKGRADVNTASGTIILNGIGGGVDANTASGDVSFNGRMRANGRYRMKTISGEVTFTIQADAPGFTATLTTYSGELETDFPLKVTGIIKSGPTNRRMSGVYGDGGAQIDLDSFSGSVRIVKAAGGALKECK